MLDPGRLFLIIRSHEFLFSVASLAGHRGGLGRRGGHGGHQRRCLAGSTRRRPHLVCRPVRRLRLCGELIRRLLPLVFT